MVLFNVVAGGYLVEGAEQFRLRRYFWCGCAVVAVVMPRRGGYCSSPGGTRDMGALVFFPDKDM